MKARALELAHMGFKKQERAPEDGERYGVAVRGWPSRGRGPEMEPGR